MWFEFARKFVLALLATILVVSVAAIAYSLIAAWREDNQQGTALLVTSREEKDPVVIQAYVSSDRVSSEDEFECWFTVYNTTGANIRNLELAPLQLLPFGTLKMTTKVQSRTVVRYESNKTKPTTSDPVRFNISASFSWTEDGAARYRLVTVGPIVVREHDESRLATLSRTYVGYLKDLAVPLLIVALTIVGTRYVQKSEVRRTSRASILERVRDYAEKYYLYMVSTARRIANAVEEVQRKQLQKTTADELDRIAFLLLQMFRNARELAVQRGGYILPDKDGEQVVVNAQDLFFRLANKVIAPVESRARAVAHVGARMDYHEFKDDALPRPAVRDYRERVRIAVTSGDRRLRLIAAVLRVYAATLSYELNVAHFLWREEAPMLELDRNELRELDLSGDADCRKLAADFRAYEKQQPKRWKRLRY